MNNKPLSDSELKQLRTILDEQRIDEMQRIVRAAYVPPRRSRVLGLLRLPWRRAGR